MLKSHIVTVCHGKFALSSKVRHVWNDSRELSSLYGRSSNSIDIRNLRSRGRCGKVHVNRGRKEQVPVNEDGCMDAFERREDSGEMAETAVDRPRMVDYGERCDESGRGPIAGTYNAVNLEAGRSSDARAQDRHEKFSYQEMMERWEFLKRLPHKLQRDIGYIILGPSLLSSSKELPVVSTSALGGSSSQWPTTKAWLQQLSIPAVEAWFASQRSSQRLGDHFALCIEYVLRHAPHVEAQQLITSQQVLQRVTEPVHKSRALRALESKLLAQKSSTFSKTAMLVDPLSNDKSHIPLSSSVGPSQDEQQQVLSECRPTTLDGSIQIFEAMELMMVGDTPQEKVGKRKRKLLKKLERAQLRKGKTTTIGEFDFLFETATRDDSEVKEFHHWEVSVKYLLYAGPWEVFGLRTPKYAAWSNPDTQDSDSKLDPLSHECLETESHGGAVRVSDGHESESNIDDEGSARTRTTTAGVYSGLNASRAEKQNDHVNAAEDDDDLFVESLGDDAGWTTQQHPREVDNFLGCYLGPHVGETLLDRKTRLRNQLALSANPYAALLLRDLYINKSTDEIAEKEMMEGLANTPCIASTQLLEPSTVMRDDVLTNVTHDQQGVTGEDRDGGRNNEEIEDLVVVPSALLKGYLFYEYKLWRVLERCSSRNVAEAFNSEQDKGSSVFEYPNNGTTQSHDVCRENEGEVTRHSGKFDGVEIQDSQLTEKASLNTNHWMGWWTREIMEFADLPVHRQSKWYIVPKLEWLSPVVIPESDTDRCARVLSLADFVVTAAQVADEAARLLMPRKRRFLVAEVRWTSDWEPCQESVSSPTCASALEKEQATMSAWLEVSRGFVVEDTWPVSKMYRPHGYVVSWCPSLQGRHVDEPET